LDEKTKECEELEQELLDLWSVLRRIREEVSRPEDVTEPATPTDEDDVHFPTSQLVLDIVIEFLHLTSGSLGGKLKGRRGSSFSKSIADLPALTIGQQTKLDHSSDSDEMPYWAEDIMADLVVIAEGKCLHLCSNHLVFWMSLIVYKPRKLYRGTETEELPNYAFEESPYLS
jgi:hypothetical protein